jgi:peroxiredoxin
MRTRLITLGLLCLALVLPRAQIHAQQAKDVAKGAVVPDHSFKTLEGKIIKLSQFKGKNVVLAFVVAGMGACHAFAPKLEKNICKVYKNRNTVVIGVFVKPRKAKQFKKTHGLTCPMAVDNRLARSFPSDGYPFVVVLDGQRRFRFSTKGIAADQMIPEIVKALKKQGA